ncbi:MAG: hypothetical protein JEZ08_17785 [Clostridiales bacterium]|nr:hypothetical protein [Clostridiales bacterium]
MGIKFVIHPIAYFILLLIEVAGMNLAANVFTGQSAENKRFIIGTLSTVVIIFLLDMFLFDFHKTALRSVLIMGVLFFHFKFINQISFVKCGIQTLVLFVVVILVDLSLSLFAKLMFVDSMAWLFDNYIFMYALYLCLFYLTIILGSTFNIKIIKIDKFKF